MYEQPPNGPGCNQDNQTQEQAPAGPPPGYGWGYYGPPPGMGGHWGPYGAGPQAGGMPGWGPMGPGAGFGPGPGPQGWGGYGPAGAYGPDGPQGMPGHEPGSGGGPRMGQFIEEMAAGTGFAGLGHLLDFEDTDFWKGALVGAAAVLLLTNETVQQSLFKSGVKARDVVEKGLHSLRPERGGDAEEPAATPAEPAKSKTGSSRARTSKKEPQS